jgi:hypothetical protein
MHRNQAGSAGAFARLARNVIAFAIVHAVANVINLTGFRCINYGCSNQNHYTKDSDHRSFHKNSLFNDGINILFGGTGKKRQNSGLIP